MTTRVRPLAFAIAVGTLIILAKRRLRYRAEAAWAKSLRPGDVKRIRTAVLRLLGWSVGIPGNVFPKLTFSEAAGMADAWVWAASRALAAKGRMFGAALPNCG